MRTAKHFIALIFMCVFISHLNAQPFQIPATANHSGGEYQIFSSPTNSTITINNVAQPVIWVEGFDANNEFDCQFIYDQIAEGMLVDVSSPIPNFNF